MALVLKDRIKETTTTTGTGTYTLAGAASGFEAFSEIGDGNTTYYACTNGVDFEVGIGTYTASGTTLARTTILQSSNSDNAVDWAAGTKDVFVTQPAEKAVFLNASGLLELSGNLDAQGNNITEVEQVGVRDRIFHDDDTNTYLEFNSPDRFRIVTGNVNKFQCLPTEVVFNEDGHSFVDFRVESDNNTHILFVSAGDDRVGIGNSAPASALDVTGDITVSGTVDGRDLVADGTKADAAMPKAGGTFTGDVTLQQSDDGSSEDPQLILNRVSSSPADNDTLGTILFRGRNDAGEVINYAKISSQIADASDGTEDGYLNLQAPDAGTLNQTFLRIGGGDVRFFRDTLFLGDNYTVTWDKSEDTLEFADNAKLAFGAGDDISLHWDGTDGHLAVAGTLNIEGSGETLAKFIDDGAVELYYDNTKRFETIATGAKVSGELQVTGDLTVSGTTTTVNSTVVTLDDPILTLGGDTAPSVDDNKDRGVEFRWYDGSAKVGFFGFDDSTGRFTFIPDATNSSEVFSGTAGDIDISNVYFPDNGKAVFGAGSDLEIFHDGSNSRIKDVGTGSLLIGASFVAISKADGSEDAAKFFMDGAVELYHDNVKMFETTSAGIKVHSTVDNGPNIDLISDDPSDAADFGYEGQIRFFAENDASESSLFAAIRQRTADISDGTENGAIYFGLTTNGTFFDQYAMLDGGFFLLNDNPYIQFTNTRSTNFDVTIVPPNPPSADRTITLPDATGTVVLQDSSGHISLGDSQEIRLGDGGDLKIYHNGTHSFIREAGTGDLRIQATNLTLESGSGELFVDTTVDGAVDIYHDNARRFATSSTGVIIYNQGAGATAGPTVELRRNSASPASNDLIGTVQFNGKDSGANDTTYASIDSQIIDVTDGSEDGLLSFKVNDGGTVTEHLRMTNDFSVFESNVIIGAGKYLYFEGTTNDNFETVLNVADPSADRTIYLPDEDGHIRVVRRNNITANRPVGWTTIAVLEGRDSRNLSNQRMHAKFTVMELSSSRHQAFSFYAQHMFGQDNGLQAIGYSTFSVDTISSIRIKASTSGNGIYAGAVIQVYINDATNNLLVTLDENNFDSAVDDNGRIIFKDGIADATDPGNIGYDPGSNGVGYSDLIEYAELNISRMEHGGMGLNNHLLVQSNDSSATEGPLIQLYRDSPSPADSDNLGEIQFVGRNDNSQDVTYGTIHTSILDASDGTEDARLEFRGMYSGSEVLYLQMKSNSNQFQRDVLLGTSRVLKFEGTTADDFETTLTVTDPTADRTITFPNDTGTVVLSGGSGNGAGNVRLFSDTTTPVLDIAGNGPNFIRFRAANNYTDTANGVDISYRTSPDDLRIERSANGNIIAEFGGDDGHVLLYYDSTPRLETTSTGVTIHSGDDGVNQRPDISLYKNSDTPADADNLGEITFDGNNDAGTPEKIEYAAIRTSARDVSDGSEDGRLDLQVMTAGTNATYQRMDFGLNQFLKSLYINTNLSIIWEGTTYNGFETTLTVANPSADRTITLPDATGTVVLENSSGNVSVTNDLTVTGDLFVNGGTIRSEDGTLDFGDNSADNWGQISYQSGATINGLDAQFSNAVRFSNEQGGTNQHMLLLDTAANASQKVWGVSVNDTPIVSVTGQSKIVLHEADGGSNTTIISPTSPTAIRTITLPDATGTVLTTGNSDTPTTTTSSSDADFVLVDDGGTMKKITPSNLGIGSGGGGNAFQTIAVSGQSNVVADSSTDTLTLVAGTGMTITTDASGDSVTFASSNANLLSYSAVNAQTGTTYTTVLADAGKLVTLNNASAITLTIPPNSSVAYDVGTVLDFCQIGAGQVTIAQGSGVTVNSNPTKKARVQYSVLSCIKIATDTWILTGDLAAA